MGNTKWKVHHNKKNFYGLIIVCTNSKAHQQVFKSFYNSYNFIRRFSWGFKKVCACYRERIVSPLETHQERVENGCAQLVLISWAPWGANHPQIKQLDIPA